MSKLFQSHFQARNIQTKKSNLDISSMIQILKHKFNLAQNSKIYHSLQKRRIRNFHELYYTNQLLEEFLKNSFPKCKILIGEVLKHQINPLQSLLLHMHLDFFNFSSQNVFILDIICPFYVDQVHSNKQKTRKCFNLKVNDMG